MLLVAAAGACESRYATCFLCLSLQMYCHSWVRLVFRSMEWSSSCVACAANRARMATWLTAWTCTTSRRWNKLRLGTGTFRSQPSVLFATHSTVEDDYASHCLRVACWYIFFPTLLLIIQRNPTRSMKAMAAAANASKLEERHQTWTKNGSCPAGTVPIRRSSNRATVADLLAGRPSPFGRLAVRCLGHGCAAGGQSGGNKTATDYVCEVAIYERMTTCRVNLLGCCSNLGGRCLRHERAVPWCSSGRAVLEGWRAAAWRVLHELHTHRSHVGHVVCDGANVSTTCSRAYQPDCRWSRGKSHIFLIFLNKYLLVFCSTIYKTTTRLPFFMKKLLHGSLFSLSCGTVISRLYEHLQEMLKVDPKIFYIGEVLKIRRDTLLETVVFTNPQLYEGGFRSFLEMLQHTVIVFGEA